MTQTVSPANFIQSIRDVRADGVITEKELAGPLERLAAATDISDDVKGEIVTNLRDTAVSRGGRGGMRLGDGAFESLQRFIGNHDHGKPGLWLDPPRTSTDPVSGFINKIRRDAAGRSGVSRQQMRSALDGLAASPNRELNAHVAESLERAHDHRDVKLGSGAADKLEDFVREQDPGRDGLNWFKPAE